MSDFEIRIRLHLFETNKIFTINKTKLLTQFYIDCISEMIQKYIEKMSHFEANPIDEIRTYIGTTDPKTLSQKTVQTRFDYEKSAYTFFKAKFEFCAKPHYHTASIGHVHALGPVEKFTVSVINWLKSNPIVAKICNAHPTLTCIYYTMLCNGIERSFSQIYSDVCKWANPFVHKGGDPFGALDSK